MLGCDRPDAPREAWHSENPSGYVTVVDMVARSPEDAVGVVVLDVTEVVMRVVVVDEAVVAVPVRLVVLVVLVAVVVVGVVSVTVAVAVVVDRVLVAVVVVEVGTHVGRCPSRLPWGEQVNTASLCT